MDWGPHEHQDILDALLVPSFCLSAICIHFVYSPLLGKLKCGKRGSSGDSFQNHALDPHQNIDVMDVPTGRLIERELVKLSQCWELEPAPQHTILSPSPQISFCLVPNHLPWERTDSQVSWQELLQGAVHCLMSVDTLHLLLSCHHLAQMGVLLPAVHFTNIWNDRDTKLTLWHLNYTLGVKKEKIQGLFLNPHLFKDPVCLSFLSQGSWL